MYAALKKKQNKIINEIIVVHHQININNIITTTKKANHKQLRKKIEGFFVRYLYKKSMQMGN